MITIYVITSKWINEKFLKRQFSLLHVLRCLNTTEVILKGYMAMKGVPERARNVNSIQVKKA